MAKRIKLLIIGPTPPPYHGVSVAIDGLLNSILIDVFDVTHLELADRRGIQHVNKPDLYDVLLFLKQWARLLALLLRYRPRIIYLVISQTTLGFVRDSLFILPSKLAGARLVLHLHGGNLGYWYSTRSALMKAYVRVVLRQIDRAIVLGESLKSAFSGLISPDRISVVPNGIEWTGGFVFQRRLPHTGPYCVLHLNTLNRMKGTLVLLEAIQFIAKIRNDVVFVFAGPWSHEEDRQEAEAIIMREGLGRYVTFTGQVDGVAKQDLLESADMFVFPGIQQEGQPLVVIEAMAAGLPVVYTNQGCLRETVVDGENGIEVRPNDPVHLAEGILQLLDRPDICLAMGRCARQRYEALYTKDRYIESMIKVFASSCTGSIS